MAEGHADALERRRLTEENKTLRQEIEELKQENGSLRQRLQTSRQKKEKLLQENKRKEDDVWRVAKEMELVKHQNTDLSREVERLRARIKQDMEESERTIHELQLALVQQMEDFASKRRVCSDDCVSSVIAMICENKELGVGVKLCCPQLRTIISLHAGPKFERKHFKCVEFMDLLKKCGIVKQYKEYKYPPLMDSRENEMAKAFNELMTMNRSLGVVIIGRVTSKAEGKGHAELCYLNSITPDRKVTIHDPQRETSGVGGEQEFIDYVRRDEGVIFYTVVKEELIQIYNNYSSVLHRNTSDPNFATAPGDVDGDH